MTERALARWMITALLLTLTGFSVYMIATTDWLPSALRKSSTVRDPTGEFAARAARQAQKPHAKKLTAQLEDAPIRTGRVMEVMVPIPPFPTKAEVKVGMPRADVISRFGEPDAVATWSERGILHEKFLYRSLDRASEVFIEAGRVSSQRNVLPGQ
jgi:hypothetical protein